MEFKLKNENVNDKTDQKEICKYGSKCYQKNTAHRERFQHPPRSPNTNEVDEFNDQVQRKRIKLTDESTSSHRVSSSDDGSDNQEEYGNASTSDLNVDQKKEENISGVKSEESIVVNRLEGDTKAKLKKVYTVEFSDDILSFYEFCESISSKSPKLAFKDIGLELVGPFDLLSGDIKSFTRTQIFLHYRYYFDPPEFYTILKSLDSEFHYGYFFDEPDKAPVFVASNDPKVNCSIKQVAANIFGAVNAHINNFLKTCDPFKQMKIKKLQSSLTKWAKEKDFTLDSSTPSIKSRNSKVNSKTFHGAGLVVPYDNKTQLGYRPLAENDKTLKDLFEKIANSESESERSAKWSKIQHVITFAEIATDECDFGTSLELGIDMFCQGHECFNQTAAQLMSTSYSLLRRKHFSDVIKVHLNNRVKNCDLKYAF